MPQLLVSFAASFLCVCVCVRASPVSATDAAFWLRRTGDNNGVFCFSCFILPVSLRSVWDVWLFYFVLLYFSFRFLSKKAAIYNKILLPFSLLCCFLLFLSGYVKHSEWIICSHLISLRWCHWIFFIDIILPVALWPWGLTQPLTEMSTRNVSWG